MGARDSGVESCEHRLMLDYELSQMAIHTRLMPRAVKKSVSFRMTSTSGRFLLHPRVHLFFEHRQRQRTFEQQGVVKGAHVE